MTAIYIYEGKYEKGELGWPLVRMAARSYLQDYGDDVNRYEIEVDQWGKPFFPHLNIDFSISHSGAMWMCAFSEKPCGVDIQERKKAKWESISERFYTPEERAFVEENGEDGFFKVWVRKEALGKLIGRGFHGPMPSLASKDGTLLDEIDLEGGPVFIREIEISKDVFCALATYDSEREVIRVIA